MLLDVWEANANQDIYILIRLYTVILENDFIILENEYLILETDFLILENNGYL